MHVEDLEDDAAVVVEAAYYLGRETDVRNAASRQEVEHALHIYGHLFCFEHLCGYAQIVEFFLELSFLHLGAPIEQPKKLFAFVFTKLQLF